MGVMQAGDDRFALQVDNESQGPDMGLDPGIVADVNEPAVLDGQSGGRAEFLIDGVDLPVDVGPVRVSAPVGRRRCERERNKQRDT
jgi:hypothetical protein